MGEFDEQIQKALEKADQYERCAEAASDAEERADLKTRARFQRSIAEELKSRLGSPPKLSR
jgi:hypothetical protein